MRPRVSPIRTLSWRRRSKRSSYGSPGKRRAAPWRARPMIHGLNISNMIENDGHCLSSDELCAYFRGDYLIRYGAGDINRECIARRSPAVGDRLREAAFTL